VSLLIGIAVGRPFDTPSPSQLGAGGTAGPTAASGAPTPTPSATPMPTSAPITQTVPIATLAPEDAWKVLTSESFDNPTTWPASEKQGWASGYEAGRYWLKLDGQRTLSYSVPFDAPEFQVVVDVQVKSGYAGLLFLAAEPDTVYRFLIDNAGRYRLERQQAGAATALRDWTAAPALRSGPEATNRIEVQRVEDELTLFANGAELAKYSLPQGAKLQSRAGMTIDAVSRDAGALAYFDNLVIRVPLVAADR